MRKSWGVEDLKKDEKGERTTDQRHHAVDAIIVATAYDKALKKLVYYAQKQREMGKSIKNSVPIEPPCHNFRNKIKDLYDNHIVVSRGEDMRARGKLHDDTLYSVCNTGEKDKKGEDILKTVKRKEVSKLELKDLDNLVGDAINNPKLIRSLKDYILNTDKKDKESGTIFPKIHGVQIKKISLYGNPVNEDDFLVRGAKPNSLSNYRIDIFTKANDKGKKLFYMVCILTHEALNKKDYPQPPNSAIDGTMIDNTFEFKFSIYPYSYVRVTKPNNKGIIEGFYRGCSTKDNFLILSERNNSSKKVTGIGLKTLDNIQKFTMNRLGRLQEIKSEKRSWGLLKQ